MPTSASTHGSSLSPGSVGTILASMFCFAVVDALAKSVALQYPANEVTFFRMLFGLFPAILLCCGGSRPLPDRLRNIDVKGQTTRAIALLGASALFFAGLPYVPLSEAVALAYSETLIVIVLAPLMLNERLTPRGAAAAIVGFLGVLLVVRPGGAQTSWLGPVILLASAFCGALSIVQIKRIRSTDGSATTVLFFTAMGTVVMGCTLFRRGAPQSARRTSRLMRWPPGAALNMTCGYPANLAADAICRNSPRCAAAFHRGRSSHLVTRRRRIGRQQREHRAARSLVVFPLLNRMQ
jgi:drug/metabolite transporter (DMT)-like permease